ncbi:MAG TPA: ABC transporter substrate-binding protein [Chloroflexota bacterium]|nr:ABC transporter substrate-binding protein [Chloroflexota bacterium]
MAAESCGHQVSRRRFMQAASVAGLELLAGCGRLPWQAQPGTPRIGYLSAGSATDPVNARRVEAFRSGLRDLGYTDGQNLLVEWRYGEREQLPALVAELVQLPVQIIVVGSGSALLATMSRTTTIPVVVLFSGDLVRLGLVASYARPGGNVTGLTYMATDLAGKRLQLLKEVVSGLSRVVTLSNPTELASVPELAETQSAAQQLGVEVRSVQVREPDELREAFAAMAREQADGLITFAHAFSLDNRQRIVDLAAERQLPAMYGLSEFAEAGGLMAYGPRLTTLYRQAATHVQKILQGASPADLPIEEPREFDFVLNLRAARALGLTMPQHVLLQATEVIQ